MAEAILNKLASGKFKAYSAGSSPDLNKYPDTKGVHPVAYYLLKDNGYDVSELYSKSWNEFIKQKESIDFAFTLCDNANEELKATCPVFPGQPITAHWGVEDPVLAKGSDEEINRVFLKVFNIIKRRIELFCALPLDNLKGLSLQQKLEEIGEEN